MKQTAIAALVAANIGRQVLVTTPEGDATYHVARLSDKLGSMKDKSKAEFVIITKDGDEATMISIHPNNATKLFKTGKDGAMTLGEPKTTAATAAADQAAAGAVADKPADEADAKLAAETAAATKAAAKEADKKAKDEKKAAAATEKAAAKTAAATKRAEDKAAKDEKKAADKAAKEAAKPITAKALALAFFKATPDDNNRRPTVIAKMKEAKDPNAAPGTLGKGGLGMSAQGANTYYQNMKSGEWA